MKRLISKTVMTALGAMLLLPSIALAQPGTNSYWVTANYIAVLGRQPDPGGWIFWTAQLNGSIPQTQLTDNFMSNGEYCGFFGLAGGCSSPPTDSQFLTLLYQNALGRQPDPSGFQFWLTQLGGGVARDAVVADFISTSEFQQRYGSFCTAYRPGYVNPLSFATSASVTGGVQTTLTVTYANSGGTPDIANGTVQIDGCTINWDTNPADVTLSGGSSEYCSAVSQTGPATVVGNPKALSIEFTLTFSELNFVGPHDVYSWAVNREGLETPSAYLGTLMVNQGPDFTLTPAPTGDSFHYLLVPQGQTINVTLSSTGLNGFSSTIGLSYGGNSCFTVAPPQTMGANDRVVIPVTNSYCGSNQGTALYFSGIASGMQRTAVPVYLLATASADFSVGVSPPTGTATVISYQSPVSYPITVSSLNGGSGTVSMSLDTSLTALPTDVNCTVSPSSVNLTSYGTASSYLNCTATPNTPGGSFPVGIIASLGSNWHTASVTLTAQTITFTTSSPPPVKNNGNSVQITLGASSPLPLLSSCTIYTKPGSPADSTTCTVQNGPNNTAVVSITAPRQTPHGVRVLQFNGGAFTTQVNVRDMEFVSGGSLRTLSRVRLRR